MNVQNVADLVAGVVSGDPTLEILRPGTIEEGRPGDLVFLANPKYAKFLATTRATAILVPRSELGRCPATPGRAWIGVDDPYAAFSVCLQRFAADRADFPREGIHPTAIVAASAVLGASVHVGAYAVVGERVRIGARTVLHPGVKIAADVEIGEDGLVESNVSIYPGSRIGNRVILRAGCVVGTEGFGNVKGKDGRFEHIPQLGIVVLEDDVEIGSNSTIARATTAETRIGRGVKIDCLVHVAHNCTVGADSALAAQVGLAGSTRIGKGCMLAGQVGVAGHLSIADGSTLAAQSGVTGSLPLPNETYMGFPAVKRADGLRRYGAFAKLPEMRDEVRELREEVRRLKERLDRPPHAS